jgi:4-diphosphocytidyl-2-C-methyl-D-erythritol kinase
MVFFPNCKINLGLQILGKREDGYHELETVFYPINLKDGLEVISDESLSETAFTQSGNILAGKLEDNLCLKAFRLLKEDYPQIPHCRIHLHKAIPDRAGLGGGSSDAAFTLKLLNEKFNLKIGEPGLLRYALQLGSDCPFFIINKPCLAGGRGEKLHPLFLELSQYKLLLIHPGIGIETKKAFAGLNIKLSGRGSLADLISLPVENRRDHLVNDFEASIFPTYPEIANIKKTLYDHGAIYASMSGSGSSVYGLFDKESVITFPPHYFQKWI